MCTHCHRCVLCVHWLKAYSLRDEHIPDGKETVGTDSACPREYFKGKPVDAICSRADRRQDGERASGWEGKK